MVLAAGLVMVKVNVLLVYRGMLRGLSDLAMVGGEATVTVGVLLVAPVPPLVELTVPVVLFFTPEVVPVTFTVTVHEPLAFKPSPVKLTLPLPATAVSVPATDTDPATVKQLPPCPLGVATTSPAVKGSVNATPFSVTVLAAALGLVKAR